MNIIHVHCASKPTGCEVQLAAHKYDDLETQ